jgi:hypothetical protein
LPQDPLHLLNRGLSPPRSSEAPLLVLELFEASRNAFCGFSQAFKKFLLFAHNGHCPLRPFPNGRREGNEEE